MKLHIRIIITLSFFSVLLPGMLRATSSNVPIESVYYDYLERLYSFGLVKTYISGKKPYSRSEFARIIRKAIDKKEREDKSYNSLVESILGELKEEFKDELSEKDEVKNRIFDTASTKFYYFRDKPTAHLETNSFNKPLVSNLSGESLNGAFNYVLRLNGYIDFSKHMAAFIEPRVVARQQGDHYDVDISKGYLKFGVSNVEFLIGRDEIEYGYGFSGGMNLSTNAGPLTLVKFSNQRYFYFPWIFKYFGRMHAELFFSVLEDGREHPHPALWGFSFMFVPFEYMEWGFSRVTMLGGRGTDKLSFFEYLMEGVFGARIYDSAAKNSGNGTFGMYVLFKLPFLRNSKIYFNGYLEDFINKNWFFTRDLAFSTGIKVPRLNSSGTLSAATEFVKTTQITYRNSIYTDGFTYNKEILGHHIGPDAWGNYTKFTYLPNLNTKVSLDFHFEKHGRLGLSQYGGPLSPALFERPENRYGLLIDFTKRIVKNLSLSTLFGYERIIGYQFKFDSTANALLIGTELSYKF